jgi:NADH oxidase (H2O2-forming)
MFLYPGVVRRLGKMSRRIVVIGANSAGVEAAIMARKKDRGAEVTVITDESVPTYSRCGLPFVLSGKISSFEKLVVYPIPLYRMMKLGLRNETRVTHIDVKGKTVEAQASDGRKETLEYDCLVIATGASPLRPPIEGLDKKGVFSLHTLEDGEGITKAMKHARSAAVIGAGYVGMEIAEAFVTMGLRTTVINSQPTILAKTFDTDMAMEVQKRFKERGVELVLGHRADAILGDESAKAVSAGGMEIPADLVINATGVRPNVGLAKEAGIEIGVTGGIKTNRRMETSVKGVYAAGDCAETTNPITHSPALPLLGATAVRQGRVAGVNAAGGYSTYPGALFSVVSQMFDFQVGATGLTESWAREYGLDTIVGKIRGHTRAPYYPGAKPIVVKILLERESKHIIGSQIIGGEEVTQRINALSLAIQKNMCWYELVKADTCYAPSVCEASEPMVMAAEMASRKF